MHLPRAVFVTFTLYFIEGESSIKKGSHRGQALWALSFLRSALSGGQSLLSDGLRRTLHVNWIHHTCVCCPAEIPFKQEGDCDIATSQLKTNSHLWSFSVPMGKSVKQCLLNVPFTLTHRPKDFLSGTFPVSLNRMICPSLCPQHTIFVNGINSLSWGNSEYVFLSFYPTGLWDSSRQELHEHTHTCLHLSVYFQVGSSLLEISDSMMAIFDSGAVIMSQSSFHNPDISH